MAISLEQFRGWRPPEPLKLARLTLESLEPNGRFGPTLEPRGRPCKIIFAFRRSHHTKVDLLAEIGPEMYLNYTLLDRKIVNYH